MTKGESAKENFMSGLNCSQAVAAAFAEEMNMPKSLVEKLTVGFGGGSIFPLFVHSVSLLKNFVAYMR